LFALEVRDARIESVEDGRPIARAGTLRFGIKAIPLLWGRLELSQIAMADADVSAPAVQHLLGSVPRNAVLGPKDAEAAVFGVVRNIYSAARKSGLSGLSFDNVALSN